MAWRQADFYGSKREKIADTRAARTAAISMEREAKLGAIKKAAQTDLGRQHLI
jgi:hypothetical protein